MVFQINLLEIDFHIRIDELDIAMQLVTKRLGEVEGPGSGRSTNDRSSHHINTC
jgi:hypothetical protein